MYAILILASAVFFAGGTIFFIRYRGKRRLSSRLLIFSAGILCSILLLQTAIKAAGGERLFPSSLLISAMQAFSMDMDYGILDSPVNLFSSKLSNTLLSVYIVVVFTAAPIAGGAMLYEVLAGVSPAIRMFFRRKTNLFVFSQLNPKSLILAGDIAEKKVGGKRTTIVFTDAAALGEDGADYLTEAKRIGAIVLQDDLTHAGVFRKARSCLFFLIRDAEEDLDDDGNLADLRELLDPDRIRSGKVFWKASSGCRIFLFTNSSETAENVRITKKLFDSVCPDELRGSVTVNVVRDQGQAALMLMKDAPLFLPLGSHSLKHPLRVVLFGNTAFSREMFKTVFWCGQLLDHPLYITVVYAPSGTPRDGVPEFRRMLDRISPEIVESCTWSPRPELLRVRRSGDADSAFAPPYAGLSFLEEDPFRTGTREMLSAQRQYGFGCGESYCLADCDYFFVMGGDSSANASLAASLRRELIRHQLVSGSVREPERRQVIAFSSEDGTLTRQITTLLEGDPDQGVSPAAAFGSTPPEIIGFGTLAERFCWQNISMDGAYLSPLASSEAHGSADINDRSGDIYERWATVGRDIHKRYKMYCAGAVSGRAPENPDLSLREKLHYLGALYGGTPDSRDLTEKLIYLEHRRWNAFIRAQGFSRPFESIDKVLEEIRNCPDAEKDRCRIFAFKDIPNRLHPCLVESAPARLPDLWRERTEQEMREDLDLLDHVSRIRSSFDGRHTDLKKYDAPGPGNLPPLTKEEALALLASCYHTGQLESCAVAPGTYALFETVYLTGRLCAKKRERISQAFRLGDGSRLERELLEKGSLRRREDGRYTVYSREAPEAGQTAEAGDYVKLDTDGCPYPNDRAFFEKNHTQTGPEEYRQTTRPLSYWREPLPHSPELGALLEKGSLRIDESSRDAYFTARSDRWETALTAAKDAVILFEPDGGFHFVAGPEFDKTYDLVYLS